MAIERRDAVRGTVIHSAHGTQFTPGRIASTPERRAAALDGEALVTAMTTR
jgi:hypothetical protein